MSEILQPGSQLLRSTKIHSNTHGRPATGHPDPPLTVIIGLAARQQQANANETTILH